MKNKVAVFSAKKAIRKHNENMTNFNEIQSRLNTSQKVIQPFQMNLSAFMAQEGMPNNFSNKLALASKFGIPNYTGKPEQDEYIINVLMGQGQKKAGQEQMNNDKQLKDKEFGFKEKELALKNKQLETSKPPTADDVANSILSKYQTQ